MFLLKLSNILWAKPAPVVVALFLRHRNLPMLFDNDNDNDPSRLSGGQANCRYRGCLSTQQALLLLFVRVMEKAVYEQLRRRTKISPTISPEGAGKTLTRRGENLRARKMNNTVELMRQFVIRATTM
jgi:hypothetical protein